MGFARVRPLVTAKYIILYTDSAVDWEASADLHTAKPPTQPDGEAGEDGSTAALESTADMEARVRAGVLALIAAWKADPTDPKTFVMREGKSPARFGLRALTGDDMMMVNDAARAITQRGEGYVARYETNRKIYLARAACIEARQVFPGDEIHSFSVTPAKEAGIGHIDDLWNEMPLEAQRILGEAILAQMESGTAKQGK